eukprot:758185-Hanusia_phi.AAC.10
MRGQHRSGPKRHPDGMRGWAAVMMTMRLVGVAGVAEILNSTAVNEVRGSMSNVHVSLPAGKRNRFMLESFRCAVHHPQHYKQSTTTRPLIDVHAASLWARDIVKSSSSVTVYNRKQVIQKCAFDQSWSHMRNEGALDLYTKGCNTNTTQCPVIGSTLFRYDLRINDGCNGSSRLKASVMVELDAQSSVKLREVPDGLAPGVLRQLMEAGILMFV